jgi:energy-coupling factor transport system permease protein
MLRRAHPLAKLAVCLVWIAAASLIMDIRLQLAVIGLSVGLLVLVDRTPLWMVAAVTVPLALFGFGFFSTAVLFRTDGGFIATLAEEAPMGTDAARAGLVLFLRAIACGLASFLFVRTTDPAALVRALMADLRLSPRIGHALFASLNAAPAILSDLHTLRLARAMRARRLPRRIPGPREALGLAVPLLAGAVQRASRTALAMEARGLARGRRQTVLDAPVWRRRDTALLLLGWWLPLVALVSF